jgi:hypothetical protein
MADLAVGESLHLWAGVARMRLPEDSDYQDVGEYNALNVTPSVTKTQYFTRKVAGRTLAKEKVSQTQAAFTLEINSLTARNISIALGGEQSTVTSGHSRVTFLETKTREVDFRFEGKNDEGQIIDFTCRVSFTPDQQFNMVGDDWSAMTVTGQVLVNSEGHFGWFDIRDQGVAYNPPPAGSA